MPKTRDSEPKDHIFIKGARMHNLKNVDVKIPRNKLVVITGVSGSGKSSLTMDTLFAEGQRRYVESLSSYARQFLMRMDKPEVDYIKGICPAIAIDQKVSTRNSRSTVGSMTEVHDYLRLLFARIGKTISPVSGEEVKKESVTDVVNFTLKYKKGSKVLLLIKIPLHNGRKLTDELKVCLQKGYSRLHFKGETIKIEDYKPKEKDKDELYLLIDRFVINKDDEELSSRIADSVSTAFFEGHGRCLVQEIDGKEKWFSNLFEHDGIEFDEPNTHMFNFNSPFGACPECEGYGDVLGVDEDLVFPNRMMSVYDGGIACWRGEKMKKHLAKLVSSSIHFDFPIHRPIKDLTADEIQLLWTGNEHFKGLNHFFKHLESKSYKIQFRVLLSRYRGRTTCPSCKGGRLRKEANYVKVNGVSISDIVSMPVSEAKVFFEKLKLSKHDQTVVDKVSTEINNRLKLMLDVGLSYLSLNRISSTLSGGETQRLNLTRMLGSNLADSLYILDEPSIGLHSRDTDRLVEVLKHLRDLGNTVVVVEHDEEIMRSADYIIDMGPEAGNFGGELVAEGNYSEIVQQTKSLTGQYLSGFKEIKLPSQRRKSSNKVTVEGARQHNLKDLTVSFPLNSLCVVTGVSGSGKTTLVKGILYNALRKIKQEAAAKAGAHDQVVGDLDVFSKIEMVDQNPIGRSSRSNPVTYIKAYDSIRNKISKQQLSLIRGYKPAHFSFNVEGGRCETCKGEGEVIVEMQFLADLHLPCEECGGKRFREDVLEVKYRGKNISDILHMTVDEALVFFEKDKDVYERLKPLADVGLGYVGLGQSSNTLSGGEAQRVKLASFLSKGSGADPVLFIFDEPTTGLHFHDIQKLLNSLNALIEKGHSVIVIEHHMDVIKSADHVIELGPDGGAGGGYLVFTGTPEEMEKAQNSPTAKYLVSKLN